MFVCLLKWLLVLFGWLLGGFLLSKSKDLWHSLEMTFIVSLWDFLLSVLSGKSISQFTENMFICISVQGEWKKKLVNYCSYNVCFPKSGFVSNWTTCGLGLHYVVMVSVIVPLESRNLQWCWLTHGTEYRTSVCIDCSGLWLDSGMRFRSKWMNGSSMRF